MLAKSTASPQNWRMERVPSSNEARRRRESPGRAVTMPQGYSLDQLNILQDEITREVYCSELIRDNGFLDRLICLGLERDAIRSLVMITLSERMKRREESNRDQSEHVCDRRANSVPRVSPPLIVSGRTGHAPEDRYMNASRISERLFRGREEETYNKMRGSLDRVVYSLVRNKSEALVREVYFQAIDNNDCLGSLAAIYSEGLERHTRGIVGPVGIDKAHPVITKYLKSLAPGALSEPFNLDGWWIILRLESLLPMELDEEGCKMLRLAMYNEWIDEIVGSLLESRVPKGRS